MLIRDHDHRFTLEEQSPHGAHKRYVDFWQWLLEDSPLAPHCAPRPAGSAVHRTSLQDLVDDGRRCIIVPKNLQFADLKSHKAPLVKKLWTRFMDYDWPNKPTVEQLRAHNLRRAQVRSDLRFCRCANIIDLFTTYTTTPQHELKSDAFDVLSFTVTPDGACVKRSICRLPVPFLRPVSLLTISQDVEQMFWQMYAPAANGGARDDVRKAAILIFDHLTPVRALCGVRYLCAAHSHDGTGVCKEAHFRTTLCARRSLIKLKLSLPL